MLPTTPVSVSDTPGVSPHRIQRSRAKGWRMPVGAVYVGRPTRWGNPWAVGTVIVDQDSGATLTLDANGVCNAFEASVTSPRPQMYGTASLAEVREHLRGKDLACWCRLDRPCHADVLLRLANA